MNTQEAMKILGVIPGDDSREIKRKYHKLISLFHPDSFSNSGTENIHQAQEINEAYRVLSLPVATTKENQKEKHAEKNFRKNTGENRGKTKTEKKPETDFWKSAPNEKIFAPRNIYMHYSMDISEVEKTVSTESMYYKIARGKYMWEPEEEDFTLFLTSIRHASSELLERTENKVTENISGLQDLKENRFLAQTRIFEYLSMECISPVKVLNSLTKPESIDGKGQKIYHFHAFLEAERFTDRAKEIIRLQPEEYLYPGGFHGNQILLKNRQQQSLGYLHMEDNRLYFCVIPLLKLHAAQIKLLVKSVKPCGKTGNAQVRADIDFYMRLETENYNCNYSDINLKLAKILTDYENYLRKNTTEKFQELFARLSRSDFRSRFHLKEKDLQYIQKKGMDTVRSHAQDFVRMRLAPAQIPNDGKQTPMRGHPVFVAQHATGCCCRGCLYKWHKIPSGIQLTEKQQEYVVDVLMEWIRRQLSQRSL